MNCHCRFFIWIVCFCILESVFVSVCGVCHTNKLPSGCTDPNETCYQQSTNTTEGTCKCRVGYTKQNGWCTIAIITTPDPHGGDDKPVTPAPRSSSSSGSTIAASVLVPIVIIAVAVIIVYSARRYQWLQRLRQLRQRRYDEVRIGQDDDDDPPIA